MGPPSHAEQLTAEAGTWCLANENARSEKMTRERIRHPKLIRDLLLDHLPTHQMDIVEVGGGPEPVSDLLEFRSRIVVDPCTDEYRQHFPCPDHMQAKIEDIRWEGTRDLVICTNALDHVECPAMALGVMKKVLRPGGYLAVMCAENNALTNPHPCHTINLDARDIHRWCDEDFETVWELTFGKDGYRYGWASFEGKRGQPAFALLMRKCVGY